jgi:hypothetical protein
VAIISHALWLRRFGGRPDIVGSTTRINGQPYQIIGVMPARFIFPVRDIGVWTPIAFNEVDQERSSHSFYAVARLRPGVTIAAAKAELTRWRAISRSGARNRTAATPRPRRCTIGVAQFRPTHALLGAVALCWRLPASMSPTCCSRSIVTPTSSPSARPSARRASGSPAS